MACLLQRLRKCRVSRQHSNSYLPPATRYKAKRLSVMRNERAAVIHSFFRKVIHHDNIRLPLARCTQSLLASQFVAFRTYSNVEAFLLHIRSNRMEDDKTVKTNRPLSTQRTWLCGAPSIIFARMEHPHRLRCQKFHNRPFCLLLFRTACFGMVQECCQ